MIPQVYLTIGMAVYDDLSGVWMTIQHLRESEHPELLRQIELIVVDNHPDSPAGRRVKNFMAHVKGDVAIARYISFGEIGGTAAPRQHVFDEANGEYVMCVDSHVMMQRGALADLWKYYNENPQTRDLISGPIVWDDGRNCATHFDDVFRGGMWGTWGHDPRGDIYNREKFIGQPFEIGAQGLGLFTCRKDAWKEHGGFNPNFTEFGGEEWYIHEKFRKAGAKCLCLPGLRWLHRFNEGSTYKHSRASKVRNYILGFRELGLPLDRVYNHFVKGINEDGSAWDEKDFKNTVITEIQWNAAIALPTPPANVIEALMHAKEADPSGTDCPTGCGAGVAKGHTIEDAYEHAAKKPSDINEHCPTLREYAQRVDRVTEFGMRHGVSTTALLAGQPKKLVSYDLRKYAEVELFTHLKGETDFQFVVGDSLSVEIDECDLLFIDTKHTAAHLAQELARHHEKVTSYIIMHDTVIYGVRGEDGSDGLLYAIRSFCKAHTEWIVVLHAQNNHGLMILSRRPEDKKPRPGYLEMAKNYAVSTAKYLAEGKPVTTPEQHSERVDICALCPLRTGDYCSQCGCPVDEKAARGTDDCPHPTGPLWPRLTIIDGVVTKAPVK